jgi:two-component system, OmpR family, sensor histidine kinase KdpD
MEKAISTFWHPLRGSAQNLIYRMKTAFADSLPFSSLEKIRERVFRGLPCQSDPEWREIPRNGQIGVPDEVMVCLGPPSLSREKLLRYASRLAEKFDRSCYAVHVQTNSKEASTIDAQTRRFIGKQLGLMVFTFSGEDIADAILRFAEEHRVGHIVIGRSHPKPFWKRFGKNADVAGNLVKNARGVSVIVLDTPGEKAAAIKPMAEVRELPAPTRMTSPTAAQPLDHPGLGELLSSRRIVIREKPVKREVVLWELAKAVWKDTRIGDLEELFKDILGREEECSTFFNEGAAFPHMRIHGLAAPVVALGLTKRGIMDVATETPIEVVFLTLSPIQTPDAQIRILDLAHRAAYDGFLFQSLRSARTPEEAMRMIGHWEKANESNTKRGTPLNN